VIIRPEILVRSGFRRYWCWKSHSAGGRPQIHAELQALIWRMSVDNRLWGHAHSWRTAQARLCIGPVDRRQVHGQERPPVLSTLSCGCPRAIQRLLVSSSKTARMEGFQSMEQAWFGALYRPFRESLNGLVALVWGYVLRAAQFQHPFATSATA
jgi:hypothetical protein